MGQVSGDTDAAKIAETPLAPVEYAAAAVSLEAWKGRAAPR